MDRMKTRIAMRLLFFLCLGRALGVVVHSDGEDDTEVFGRKSYALLNKHSPVDGDDKMIRRIEEEMLALNKSGKLPRDKRALGILLQGFMEALGYTVNPVQIASLPNPTPAAQMPAMATAPAPPPAMTARQMAAPMPPMPPPPAAAASAPAPQRETLRFTGILNFGNNANTSNLVNHLAQYESLFHGNATPAPPPAAGAAPPPAAPAMIIDPRSRPPLPEPLFVKIPLPIAPNLPPPQPPSPMPIKNTYQEEFTKDHEEEYQDDKENSNKHGDYEEEDDKSHHREEYGSDHDEQYDSDDEKHEANGDKYENNGGKYENEHETNENNGDKYENEHDKYENNSDKYENEHEEYENKHEKHEKHEKDEPKDRNYDALADDGPPSKPKSESKETEYKNAKEVINYSVENKELHDPSEVSEEAPVVGSKYGHTMYVGEPNWKQQQEDHLYKLMLEQEAKAEALAEQNSQRQKESAEENVERSRSREKEITESNQEKEAEYHAKANEQPYYEEDEGSKESYSASDEEEDRDYEQESKISEKPAKKEPPAPPPKPDKSKSAAKKKAEDRRFEEYADHDERKAQDYNDKNYYDYEEGKEGKHYKTLPISYDREKARKGDTLRDSYGKSLEKPGGKVDERVGDYFTMFKNPNTGVYDPTRIQQSYEPSHVPFDHTDLLEGFKRVHQEYGRPESKYEEYEIPDDDEDRAEPRAEHNKKAACNCDRDGHPQEARSSKKSVTTGRPRTGFGYYYPTVKYLSDPTDDDGIIARLTSYGPPTTARFEDRVDLARGTTFVDHTPTGPPERPTTQSLLTEAETKEIRAWPAPFDYVFDNSERNERVVKGTSAAGKRPPKATTTRRPDCSEAPPTLPPGKYAERVQLLLRNHENGEQSQRRPATQTRRGKQSGQQTARIRYNLF